MPQAPPDELSNPDPGHPNASRDEILPQGKSSLLISPGLFGLMTDRAVLYSYLLPQRFSSWSHCMLGSDESPLDLDFDEKNLSKFVLSFIVNNSLQEEQPLNVAESRSKGSLRRI